MVPSALRPSRSGEVWRRTLDVVLGGVVVALSGFIALSSTGLLRLPGMWPPLLLFTGWILVWAFVSACGWAWIIYALWRPRARSRRLTGQTVCHGISVVFLVTALLTQELAATALAILALLSVAPGLVLGGLKLAAARRAGPPQIARRPFMSTVLQATTAASLAASIALQHPFLRPGLTVAATLALAGAVVDLLPPQARRGAGSLSPPLPP